MNKLISGRYRIIGNSIGMGGMSIVYKAMDEKDGRVVALKVLKEEFEKNEEYVKRFRREATAASKMSHENIVKIYAVGNDGPTQYLVMEYVEGHTLSQIIKQEGRLKSERAVRYALKILAAINHAHQNNIIHRDIKPQNILIDKNDNVKVADFGIARLVDSSSGTLTDSNTVMGSVHYISPEQANGDPVDEKSDLYSMGVVIYEMLTGEVPFEGETPVAIALKQVNELPRSMRLICKDIPRSLDEVVLKALEKDPMLRYFSAAEMAKDLKHALRAPKGGFVNNNVTLWGRIKNYVARNGLNAILVVLSCVTILVMVIYGFMKVSDILYGVDVPQTVGLTLEEAQALIQDSDMEAVVNEVYSNSFVDGTVISQSPEGGSRGKRGKSVTVTVSIGAQPVELPSTVGMNKTEALKLLSDCGFPTVTIKYEWVSNAESDIVLEQSPSGGNAKMGAQITLVVNSDLVKVPALTGKQTDIAIDTVEALGLTAHITYAYSSDDAPGTVLLQSPAPGTEVTKGTEIELFVTLSMQKTYYASCNLRCPLSVILKAVLTSPSGAQTVVYEAFAEAGEVVTLELESNEAGEYTLEFYGDDEFMHEETVEFK